MLICGLEKIGLTSLKLVLYNTLRVNKLSCLKSQKFITETRKDRITEEIISFNYTNLKISVSPVFRASVIIPHIYVRDGRTPIW